MRGLQHPIWPILVVAAGVAMLSLMDAVMKGAALAIGAYSAALLRSAIGAAISAPLWAGSGWAWPAPNALKLHIERGIISAFMALTFFFALTKLPVAETIAISFIAPLIALYLARLLLGETVSRAAILASILGFGGTIIIVGGRLGEASFDQDTALGLASILFSACLYAYNFIVIRRQSQVAGPLEVATFHSGIGGLVLLLAAPWFFIVPDGQVLRDIAIGAALTVGGSLAITWSYARAEAQALVPVEYSGFLWAVLFGWMFFREEVSATTIVGVVLIVIACLVALRQKAAADPEAGNRP